MEQINIPQKMDSGIFVWWRLHFSIGHTWTCCTQI